MTTKITMPKLGESVVEEIGRWLKDVGDAAVDDCGSRYRQGDCADSLALAGSPKSASRGTEVVAAKRLRMEYRRPRLTA